MSAQEKERGVQSNVWRLRVALLVAALLMLVTFSMPQRSGPTQADALDLIALAKLATRAAALTALLLLLLTIRPTRKLRTVVGALLPMGAFLAFAFLSTVWSPLPAISLGQVSSHLVLVVLAATIGACWRSQSETSTVLLAICSSLLLVSSFTLLIHFSAPELSGLRRELHESGESLGLVHPTNAGATASLGLLILILSSLLWHWRWSKVLLGPGILIFGSVLWLSASRASLASLAITLAPAFLWLAHRPLLALLSVVVSVAGSATLVMDPRLRVWTQITSSAADYLKRGQSWEALSSASGRFELWSSIWKEFLSSPFWGHGYFVTSSDGALDVWSGPANHSAHNILLQTLVSTGLFGALLLAAALVYPIWRARRSLTGPDHYRLGALLGVLALWYSTWGMFCSSFTGPIQPESVVFFASLGLLLGNVRITESNAPCPFPSRAVVGSIGVSAGESS